MIFLVLAVVPGVTRAQFISGEIPYTPTPPVLDGLADDAVWDAATEYSDFETVSGALTGPDDSFTIWKGLWDNENLYFHVSVVDDVIGLIPDNGGDWNTDSVEFYFDTQLHGLTADALGQDTLDYTTTPASDEPIFQLTMLVDQTELHNGINSAKYITDAGDSELNGAWVVDGSFYSYEVSFPWSALGTDVGEVFDQDGVIGFGMAINDEDDGAGRDAQTMWASTSPELWHDATAFPFVKLLEPPDDGLACDFDADADCDVADLNGLQGALGSNNATYDLDSSGTVDAADTNSWLTIAGNENVGAPYVRGDTNLDGDVDAGDLNALGTNWQRTDSPGWDEGNFNGDEFVNASDLNDLGVNWLQGTAAPLNAAVPEPGGLGLLGIGLMALASLRRRS
jgi:hypothetical protein